MFYDPQCLAEAGQAIPLSGESLVQAVPSQMSIVCWDAMPFASPNPISPIPREDMQPMGNIPDLSDRGFSLFSSSPPAFYTHSPQTVVPYLLADNFGAVPTAPGTATGQPTATHNRSPPTNIPDPSVNSLTGYTEDAWQFLRMQGQMYECLWDDGSGRLCGYLGPLIGIKRHLRSSHRLRKYASGYQSHPVSSDNAPQVNLLSTLWEVT